MNVLVATGKRELDEFFTQYTNSPIPPISYKEGVLTLAQQYQTDVVVLSAFLDGNMNNKELLYELRKQGTQVIMLIGSTDPDEIRREWLPLGVYDFVTDPVTEEKIRLSLEYPATLGMAEERLKQIEQGIVDESEDDPPKKRRMFWKRKRDKKQKEDSIHDQKENKSSSQQLNHQETHREQIKQDMQWSFEHSNEFENEDTQSTKVNNERQQHHDESLIQEHYVKDKSQGIKEMSQKEERSQVDIASSVWNFQQDDTVQSVSLPQDSFNIVVTSPVSS